MKQTIIFIAILMAIFTLPAQDKIDSYGKINKADLDIKVCDFDKDAEALCLFDVGEVFYNFTAVSIDMQANYRKRIKILKEKGIEKANIKIRYYSKDNFEEINNIGGVVYNLDDAGNIVTTKLEKNLIYNKKIDSRYSEISFALPNVKVGSVIEYKYRSFKKNNYYDIDDWYFQSDIPVRYSAYNLVIPDFFDFTYHITRRQAMDDFKSKNATEGQWFIMRNIPALKEEPYMAAFRDYLQRVDFQLSAVNPPNANTISFRTTWDKLTDELLVSEYFGNQFFKKVPGTGAPLKLLLADATTDLQKTAAIYKFVQSNMGWNGAESRNSYEGIKDAWIKKQALPEI